MRLLVSKIKEKFIEGALILLVLTFSACVKDMERPLASAEYTPLIAVPVVNSTLNVSNLLVKDTKNGTVQADSTNFLSLIYRGRLFSLQANTIVKIPNQAFSYTTPGVTPADTTVFNSLPVGSSYPLPMFADTVAFTTSNTAAIDSVVFEPGTVFSIDIISQFTQNATITVTIPHAKKNGIPFTQTFNIIYPGAVIIVGNLNVSGYTFDMTEGGTASNEFNIDYSITLEKSTNIPMQLTDNASMSIGFNNTSFQKLFGYIEQPFLSPNLDTVAITLFNNTIPGGGTFTLVNPQVRFILTNSYGVPINATFNTLMGYNPPAMNYPITVVDPKLTPWQMPYPSITQIGQSVMDSVTISNANTNNTLSAAINHTPKFFVYSVNSQANPNGKPVAPNTNFVLDTSRFIVDFQITLPFWGTASNIMLMDTIPFTLSGNTTNNVDSLLMKINATNGFPVDMGFQVYFTDSISPTQRYNIIDSVVSPYQVVLPSASVDTNTGKVNMATTKMSNFTFGRSRINKIKNVHKLILKGTFVTYNNAKTNVKMYSTYFMTIKIGVLAQLQTKI
ncbi:MAG TPA: hypothetical protein VK783_14565 [Bacteroidia bacterium]|nr:hypothetical protein [Bacteroidia bacterium]